MSHGIGILTREPAPRSLPRLALWAAEEANWLRIAVKLGRPNGFSQLLVRGHRAVTSATLVGLRALDLDVSYNPVNSSSLEGRPTSVLAGDRALVAAKPAPAPMSTRTSVKRK